MASGATGQAISGAAQGAAAGAVLGPWGAVVGGVLGGVGGFISGSSADSQQANQAAWARYNTGMQYQTDMYNINSSLAIAGLNASAVQAAAIANAGNIQQAALYNSSVQAATSLYNTSLLSQEEDRVWQDLDLDLEQLQMFRARERGEIVSDQSNSGTVIGEGSNEDVVVSQMTMEAMDANILQFDADRKAADIQNSIAQGLWQGGLAIQQTMWEGEMATYSTLANAQIQASSIIGGARIQAMADKYSATQKFTMGHHNIDVANTTYGMQQEQKMVAGLFKAGTTYATGAFARKIPGTKPGGYTTSGGGGGAPGGYTMAPTYISQSAPAYSGPGSSLAVGR